ncbi:unnamed protein product [Schistosoma spindalis]|nr:unnamed protein product [Schistosoma spindale]
MTPFYICIYKLCINVFSNLTTIPYWHNEDHNYEIDDLGVGDFVNRQFRTTLFPNISFWNSFQEKCCGQFKGSGTDATIRLHDIITTTKTS